jgi:hypothetical protein
VQLPYLLGKRKLKPISVFQSLRIGQVDNGPGMATRIEHTATEIRINRERVEGLLGKLKNGKTSGSVGGLGRAVSEQGGAMDPSITNLISA